MLCDSDNLIEELANAITTIMARANNKYEKYEDPWRREGIATIVVAPFNKNDSDILSQRPPGLRVVTVATGEGLNPPLFRQAYPSHSSTIHLEGLSKYQ